MLSLIFCRECVQDVGSLGYFLYLLYNILIIVIKSIKSEVLSFPIVIIFFVIVCLGLLYNIFGQLFDIYPGKLRLSPLLLCTWCTINLLIGCSVVWRSYFSRYIVSLSSLCRFILRHWTYKMHCHVCSVGCVSKIKSILSIIFMLYLGCVFRVSQSPPHPIVKMCVWNM